MKNILIPVLLMQLSWASGNGTKALFSYVADGLNVNFTNFSTNATEFHWHFGDGSGVTSDLRSPQHVFTRQ